MLTADELNREIFNLSAKLYDALPARDDDAACAVKLGALAGVVGRLIQELPPQERQQFVVMNQRLTHLALGMIDNR